MKESDSDTIVMVILLVAVVGGVFVLFALMALCYRYCKLVNRAYSYYLVKRLTENRKTLRFPKRLWLLDVSCTSL